MFIRIAITFIVSVAIGSTALGADQCKETYNCRVAGMCTPKDGVCIAATDKEPLHYRPWVEAGMTRGSWKSSLASRR
jgi:hypothetical protein